MNFKTKSFVVLLIISVFLLSGCEVYQTLYGTGPQKISNEVVRVEGEQAKDINNFQHDPFKVGENPLGPFPKGESLGFTLGQWLAATGSGTYSVDGDNAELKLSFKNLVPDGIYTVWCSRLKLPPDPIIVDRPCGLEDGSGNTFKSEAIGTGSFNLKLKPLEPSDNNTVSVIALAYHSDGKTYGANPGDFGLNSHVQLYFIIPTQSGKSYQVPVQFINHIEGGLPEQDVFIEAPEKAPEEKMEEHS